MMTTTEMMRMMRMRLMMMMVLWGPGRRRKTGKVASSVDLYGLHLVEVSCLKNPIQPERNHLSEDLG